MSRYHRAYANTSLETMSPSQMLSALYKRLIRDLDEADAKIVAGDIVGKGTIINHAHAIVSELSRAVNVKVAPELGPQLRGLYAFMLRELVMANAKMSREHIANTKKVALTLQDAFDEAILSLSAPIRMAAIP
jgi:flagellar protein FliS